MKVDYMKPSGWKKVKVNDKTKKDGRPSPLAMQRVLYKTLRDVWWSIPTVRSSLPTRVGIIRNTSNHMITTVRLDTERTRKKQEIKEKTGKSLTDIVVKAIDKEYKKLWATLKK